MAQTLGGRWRIVSDLPHGGQAHVFLVKDMSGAIAEQCVLKRLDNPLRLARFVDEVSTLRDLDHRGITRLLDFDLEAERPWFVQEYCEGGNLEDFVLQGKLTSPRIALEFFIQLCDALAYAHDRSKVHRDIKPANVFLRTSEGPAVLGDFGLTFVVDGHDERITLTFEQVGSRFYMAPELRDGILKYPTPSCDIYSLGKVLYFMLTNGKKFDRENFDDPSLDVVKLTGNMYLEHANILFRKMIVRDPGDRTTAQQLADEGTKAMRLIEGSYPALEGRHLPPCNYCGIGNYEQVANNLSEYMGFFGFTTSGVNSAADGFRAMACDHCGHVQVFKMKSPGRTWWRPGSG